LDKAAYEKLMTAAELALRQKPQRAEAQLESLQTSMTKLHPLYREMTPSSTKINESRRQIASARDALLQIVATK